MRMKNNKKNGSLFLHIVTPFIVGALCVGIAAAAAVKPYDKAKVYLNIAFMDDLRTDPSDSSSGLIIRDNEIITGYSGKTSDKGEVVRAKYGELYALLSSDALDLTVPVYWGSDIELFERGACQATASAVIGNPGNTVISAHVDTFFAELGKLKVGDTVTLNTNYGEFTYKVTELIEFDSSDKTYIAPTKDDRLTLYTCRKDVLGSSDMRFGVVCELTERRFYVGEGDE